jgi:demethoxyubiquinone hydroxylase (CLK1/Coq7/Cat5 family)
MPTPDETVIAKLNTFLRGEISAVETYRQALQKVTAPQARVQLEECEQNHQQRIDLLRARIAALGGTPSQDSGAWGTWAKLLQTGGNLLGEKTAVDALESGEDHGLREYRRELDNLDGDTRSFVESQLLPQAERTHGTLSTLKRTIH